MPCYQVQIVSVVFKVKHVSILQAAAKALGWAYSAAGRYVICGMVKVDMERGIALSEGYGGQDSINQLKVEYSRQAVKKAAMAVKKKKWYFKEISRKELQLRAY